MDLIKIKLKRVKQLRPFYSKSSYIVFKIGVTKLVTKHFFYSKNNSTRIYSVKNLYGYSKKLIRKGTWRSKSLLGYLLRKQRLDYNIELGCSMR